MWSARPTEDAFEVEDYIICGTRGWFYDDTLSGIPENTDFGNIPAPLTDISFSRITWEQNRQRFTLPGIYTARIFTIPAK